MNHFLHGVARSIAETFPLPEPIVEVGSYQVEGQSKVPTLRSLFVGRRYIGVDMRPGPGVDCVANVEELPYADGSVGTLLAFNTFEHVKHFWRAFDEVKRVLRPDGVFVLSCPFHFHIHNYPHDYWRFTPAALESLLEDYPHKLMGWHGAKQRPASVWSVAFRSPEAAISTEQYQRYRERMVVYAREPRRSWGRRLRYRLASLLAGRGPFASYLDHDHWESVCQSAQGLQAQGQGRERWECTHVRVPAEPRPRVAEPGPIGIVAS